MKRKVIGRYVRSIGSYKGRLCEVSGCSKLARAKNLCEMHYQRRRKRGTVGGAASELQSCQGLSCTVKGCSRPARAKTFCGMHYKRFNVHGDPGPANRLVPPKKWHGVGSLGKDGYVRVSFSIVWS